MSDSDQPPRSHFEPVDANVKNGERWQRVKSVLKPLAVFAIVATGFVGCEVTKSYSLNESLKKQVTRRVSGFDHLIAVGNQQSTPVGTIPGIAKLALSGGATCQLHFYEEGDFPLDPTPHARIIDLGSCTEKV